MLKRKTKTLKKAYKQNTEIVYDGYHIPVQYCKEVFSVWMKPANKVSKQKILANMIEDEGKESKQKSLPSVRLSSFIFQ